MIEHNDPTPDIYSDPSAKTCSANVRTKTDAASVQVDGLVRFPLSCDQVAWLLDVFDRYLPSDEHPRISQARQMQKYGMLYEVMDIARLKFDDDSARWNGTPNAARKYEGEI